MKKVYLAEHYDPYNEIWEYIIILISTSARDYNTAFHKTSDNISRFSIFFIQRRELLSFSCWASFGLFVFLCTLHEITFIARLAGKIAENRWHRAEC
jgi:hypothetical protein